MAKKSSKKAPKKKTAPARKSRAAKPAPAPKKIKNPSFIKTGRGPSPAEIGNDLVTMFNRGQMTEIEHKWWSPKITSIEGVGVAMAWHGRKAVEEKNQGWMATHRIHGASAEGPYVGASGFAVKFAMDVEDTTNNSRVMMEEVGVYTVENGKIVREEFMYGRLTPVTNA